MPFPRSPRPILITCCTLLPLGCRELGGGPCVHTYRDPVLAVTAASDGATGARIAPLFVTGVTVRDRSQPVSYLLAVSFGARAQGDTIVCGVPCGFGTSEGPYSFVVSATGYAPRQVSVDARFARFDGGCPSFNEGSTEVSLSLPRAP